MNSSVDPLREIRDAIDSVTRYAARGCSGMACDRARHAWMGNQLSVIGRAAEGASDEVRKAVPGVPWDSLVQLSDEEQGVASMTADEMQRYVEHVLPGVRKALPPSR